MRSGYRSKASNQRYIQIHKSKEIDQTYRDKEIDQIQGDKYIVQMSRPKDRFKSKTAIYSSHIYSAKTRSKHTNEKDTTTKIKKFESG